MKTESIYVTENSSTKTEQMQHYEIRVRKLRMLLLYFYDGRMCRHINNKIFWKKTKRPQWGYKYHTRSICMDCWIRLMDTDILHKTYLIDYFYFNLCGIMTKTYRHKVLWITAIIHETTPWVAEIQDQEVCNYIGSNIVLQGSDREEVIEKDWIDKVLWHMFSISDHCMCLPEKEVRELIEKHAPKVKKFAISEVQLFCERNNPYNRSTSGEYVIKFLAHHWLLEE